MECEDKRFSSIGAGMMDLRVSMTALIILSRIKSSLIRMDTWRCAGGFAWRGRTWAFCFSVSDAI